MEHKIPVLGMIERKGKIIVKVNDSGGWDHGLAKRVGIRVTLEGQVSVITENYSALDLG
jgi:hypothetical protein